LSVQDIPHDVSKYPGFIIAQSIPKCATLNELSDLVFSNIHTHFNEVMLGLAMGRLIHLIQAGSRHRADRTQYDPMSLEAGREIAELPEGAEALIKMLLKVCFTLVPGILILVLCNAS
jgi:hypothetical protein